MMAHLLRNILFFLSIIIFKIIIIKEEERNQKQKHDIKSWTASSEKIKMKTRIS